jgi:hypothetical protein
MINWQTVAQIISIGFIVFASPIIILALVFEGGTNFYFLDLFLRKKKLKN